MKGLLHSRIDHILVRKQNADGGARCTQHIWTAPFLQPKPEGHAPVFAHIPFNWHPRQHPAHGCGVTVHQRLQGRTAWCQGNAAWLEFMSTSTMALHRCIADVPASDTAVVEHMNDVLVRCFQTHFKSHSRITPPVWTSHGSVMHNKWHHRKQIQNICSFTLHSILRTWHHAARYACLRRQHKKHAYAVRQARFQELLVEAANAAASHDSFRLYSVINKYSPKTARRRMQLRNRHGTIATPQEELAILKSYVATKWHGPATISCPWTAPPGVPFDVQELERAISLIPCNKSVAFPYAPGLAWREHASTIAGPLYQALESWWSVSPPIIPQTWRDGWLILIPKPNKAPTAPKQLRPLALQEPIGKCILGLITQYAQRQTQRELCSWPLWAYLRNRSTLDALMHVCNHCKQVRSLIHAQRPTAFNRRQRSPTYKVCGGLQLFVDIDNALDAVNRIKLFGELHHLGLAPDLIAILTAWHCSTSYHILHMGEDHSVMVGRGLRQGCRAAPYLWNCFITLCLHRMASRINSQFIREHITIFADDMHIAAIYYSSAELETLNCAFGIFLDTLREFDLAVNPNKTFIILAMSGTACRKAWTDLIHRDSNGVWAKIRMPDASTQSFPVVKSTKYLGAVVSYGLLEDQTLRYRIKMAKLSFHRLKQWLCTHTGLPVTERFKLWQSCVLPVIEYGLLATGITDKGLSLFQTTVFTMLRTVLHDHPFRTRTHIQALARLHIDPPLALLHRAAIRQCRTVESREHMVDSTDVIHMVNWQPLQDLVRRLEHWITPGPSADQLLHCVQAPKTILLRCAKCDFATHDAALFRRHCTQRHGKWMVKSNAMLVSDFAQDGMPQCKYCHQTFTTWRSLQTHAQRGCQALQPGPAECLRPDIRCAIPRPKPSFVPADMTALPDRAVRGHRMLTDEDLQVIRAKPWGSALLTLVTNRDFRRLSAEREACQFLTDYCGLCGLYVGRVQSMHLHMRTQHSEFWQHVPNKCTQLCNQYSQEPPCNCCGSNLFRSHHMCPVWAQVALLLIHGGGLEGRTPEDTDAQLLTCDLCHEVFASTEALTGHLHQEHGLIATSWNQSRDSIDNSPACAHCGTVYACMAGLRSHISQGRCAMYNPEASSETQPVAAEWIRYCVNGKLLELYRTPMLKLRLTLTCQCCNRHFRRSMDLSLHLMTAHAALWHASQRTLHLLTQAFYEKWGCACNPTTNVLRVQHVCVPFKQLAMQFHRQADVPLMPIQLTDQHIATLLSVKLTRHQRFVLEQALTERRFEAFWSDDAVLAITRNYCLLCGARHHAAELCHHIHEDHVCTHELITYYKQQLMSKFAQRQQVDHQCASCQMIFNLPLAATETETTGDRFQLVQIHFAAQCPCLLQTCVLLASALNGCVEPRFPDGSGSQSNARSFSPGLADDRQRALPRTRSAKPKTSQGSKKARTGSRRPTVHGSEKHAGDDEAHGNDDPASRPGYAESQAKRQFHTLVQQGALRHPVPTTEGGGPVERTDGTTQCQAEATAAI